MIWCYQRFVIYTSKIYWMFVMSSHRIIYLSSTLLSTCNGHLSIAFIHIFQYLSSFFPYNDENLSKNWQYYLILCRLLLMIKINLIRTDIDTLWHWPSDTKIRIFYTYLYEKKWDQIHDINEIRETTPYID